MRQPPCCLRRARTSTACARWLPESGTPGWWPRPDPRSSPTPRKVFIPITRLCRDRCHYCTFVETPGHADRDGRAPYLSPDEILDLARQGAELGCLEALFTLGDRPEDRWPEARAWLDEQGYDSTLAYCRAMAIRVLEETGLLPHLNPGVMTWEEMNRLKAVSPSLGMMLETTSIRLHTEPGQAHFGSPDKDPVARLRVLADAGRLAIPFTTGLLVGIGENLHERAETIFALRQVSREYGSVQEVIVQNFRAKPDTAMRHSRRPRPRRVPRGDRRHPPRPRAPGTCPGAPEPGRPRGVPRAAGRGHRRLGRRLSPHPRPREPRAPVAVPRSATNDQRRGRVRAASPADHPPGVRAARRAVARSATLGPRGGPRGP